MKYRQCQDCATKYPHVPKKLFCNSCYKRRYGYLPNPTNLKTIAGAGLDSGGGGTLDTRREHSEGSIRVHRPDSTQGRADPSGAGNQLQQHISPSPQNRKRRIVVGSAEVMLAYMGYRMAQAKQSVDS
jgi:hypothetical protein